MRFPPLLSLLVYCLLLSGCAEHKPKSPTPASNTTAAEKPFFVATNGNDQWSGRLPKPNFRKSDGPFATLPRALEAVRESKRETDRGTHPAATVFIRRGFHFLSEPLVLKSEDSSILFAAYPGETPVISGGRRITGWKETTDNTLWTAEIPEARGGKWFFRELWVNGNRAVRARHPNKGYLTVEAVPDAVPSWEQGNTRFRFKPGDIKSSDTITNAEVVVMNRWVESRLPVFGLDEKEGIISFSKRSVFGLAAGDHYYVEGAFEFLDEPGEWYLDHVTGTLYYMPRPGEKLNQIEAIAPVLSQVVRLEGETDASSPQSSPSPLPKGRGSGRGVRVLGGTATALTGKPQVSQFVEHVTFRGLTFAHTEWYFPTDFHFGKKKAADPQIEVGGFSQAAVGVPGAVWGEGARDCAFEACKFIHLGNYSLELARGCNSNAILHCEFSDLGAGGVKIGETAIREDAAEQTGANEISDCHIHDGGKMFASAEGIWVGQSPNNRITHNLIHDFYYTGISLGWTWGYGKSLTTNNAVEFNHVHHIGVKSDGDGPILSDMGGIYTLGVSPGTVIRNNLWHDIAGISYGGWGIYFDEGTSGIVAESNVVYRTTHGGFHQHYGETNIIRNNIFAFGRDAQIQRTRPEPHISFSFQTNIVYFNSGALLTGEWSDNSYNLDANVYFDARPDAKPESLLLGKGTLEKWRERGHDRNSIVADPLFVAPQQNDFRLQTNSPALKLGFKPIDLTHVGPR